MEKQIPIFQYLCIETSGFCNRVCSTCLRNSYPDREAVSSYFSKETKLETDVVFRLINELAEFKDFKGEICFQHYNEPLLDERIVEFGKYAKSRHFKIFFVTNGDYLTAAKAKELDGVFDYITISIYSNPSERDNKIKHLNSLFNRTQLNFVGQHFTTHYSPKFSVKRIEKVQNKPCDYPLKRLIINHKGEMLMCCDDLAGVFDLGNIYGNTLEELWYSDKHQKIVTALLKPGGRKKYSFCSICPRYTIEEDLSKPKLGIRLLGRLLKKTKNMINLPMLFDNALKIRETNINNLFVVSGKIE